jgi:TetR/AcrR family transcriptional regulator
MARATPPAIVSELTDATAVFAEHGVDRTSVDDISKQTGVPRATLYYCYAGKKDSSGFVLQSLLVEIAERVTGALAFEGAAIDRPRAGLAAQVHALGSDPDAAQLLVANPGRAGRLRDIASAPDAAYHETCA